MKVVVLAAGPEDRLVRFRAWPFSWEGAPPQSVTLSVNGARVATLSLPGGAAVQGVVTPAAAWRDGENALAFEFAWAEAPKDRVPGAADARTLAAAFDWIEVVPVRPVSSPQP